MIAKQQHFATTDTLSRFILLNGSWSIFRFQSVHSGSVCLCVSFTRSIVAWRNKVAKMFIIVARNAKFRTLWINLWPLIELQNGIEAGSFASFSRKFNTFEWTWSAAIHIVTSLNSSSMKTQAKIKRQNQPKCHSQWKFYMCSNHVEYWIIPCVPRNEEKKRRRAVRWLRKPVLRSATHKLNGRCGCRRYSI